MFRKRRHREASTGTQESLARAQADRREQEHKSAEEQDVAEALDRIRYENDVARLLRLVLGGR